MNNQEQSDSFGLDELRRRFPGAWKKIPKIYREEYTLIFTFNQGKLCSEHDTGMKAEYNAEYGQWRPIF